MLSATLKGAYDNVIDALLLICSCCFLLSLCKARFCTQQPQYSLAVAEVPIAGSQTFRGILVAY